MRMKRRRRRRSRRWVLFNVRASLQERPQGVGNQLLYYWVLLLHYKLFDKLRTWITLYIMESDKGSQKRNSLFLPLRKRKFSSTFLLESVHYAVNWSRYLPFWCSKSRPSNTSFLWGWSELGFVFNKSSFSRQCWRCQQCQQVDWNCIFMLIDRSISQWFLLGSIFDLWHLSGHLSTGNISITISIFFQLCSYLFWVCSNIYCMVNRVCCYYHCHPGFSWLNPMVAVIGWRCAHQVLR